MPGIACKIDLIYRRDKLTLATITSLTVSTKQIQKVHLFDIAIGSDLKICVKELMVDFFALSENSWIPAFFGYNDTTIHPVSTGTFCRLCFLSNKIQPQVSTNVKVPTSQSPHLTGPLPCFSEPRCTHRSQDEAGTILVAGRWPHFFCTRDRWMLILVGGFKYFLVSPP